MGFDGLAVATAPVRKKAAKLGPRGCDACPLNKVNGINKIMGRIEGKDILIVAQSPGPEENEAGQELVGRSGKFLWDELEVVGIRREDCDIQNVVRCFPADLTEGSYNSFLKMRNPTAQEIHCCSIHTETAMAKARPKHILILGQVAQKAFLDTRSVPKQKIFWSDRYKAKIYLADHPAFFIRGYGAGARLEAFQSTLRELAAGWRNEEVTSDNFGYLRKQKYYLVSKKAKAEWVERIINTYARQGRRIAVDIEHDDELYPGTVIFAIGFSPKPGLAFTLVFDYPGLPDQTDEDAQGCWDVARRILEDDGIRKVFHYGCSDVTMLEKAKVRVRGYDWDTYISEYLWYPDAKAYGLEAVSNRRHQQFAGYKMLVVDDLMAALGSDVKVPTAVSNGTREVKAAWLSKNGYYHLSRLKPETLRLYNCADSDLTKRLEIDSKKRVRHALVLMYIDLSFVLKDMEANGPWFDTWQADQLLRLKPHLADKQKRKLQKMVGNPDFNPGSPDQVYDAVYEHFGLVYPLRKGKPNTQKKTMLMLGREHPFPPEVVTWRKLSKAESTINGYKECALKFGGRLSTIWKMDGTSTGRLSSSGGDDGGTNLQNVAKEPQMQNMLVADKRWRTVFNAITVIIKTKSKWEWESAIEAWLRENMPDLKTFLVLDYGQIEIRVLAMLADDKNLLKDCASGDIHSAVGSTMTGWAVQKIKEDDKTRTLTKNVHFGMVYLIAKHNLYDFIKAMDPTSDVTEKFVSDAYDRYFERYRGVGRWQQATVEFAQEHHFVETIFGLHRVLNVTDGRGDDEYELDVVAVQEGKQTSWRSQAVNTPVQGTAHQLLECGLVNHRRQPEKYAVLGLPCMDVHDALYYRVDVLQLPEAYRKARYLMEQESLATVKRDFPEIEWTVPIVVDAKAGIRLGAKVSLKDDNFTPGKFMVDWYMKTKEQLLDMKKQMRQEGLA